MFESPGSTWRNLLSIGYIFLDEDLFPSQALIIVFENKFYTPISQRISFRHLLHILTKWLKCIYIFINYIYLTNSIWDK